MKRRLILSFSLIATFGFILLPGSVLSRPESLKEQLVGTWRSVSTVVTRKDGTRLEPFGKQPVGILIFTANGNVALIVTRSDAPKIAASNRLEGTPEEYRAIMRGTHAFFGTYGIDDGAKSFTISILGGTFPNEVGRQSKRTVTAINSDELKFTYAAGGAAGALAQATWRRAN